MARACVEMEVTTDIDANKVVDEETSTNVLTLEEDKEVSQKGIELSISHQLVHGEKPSKEKCEAIQLDEGLSEEKHEALFSDEKLENEAVVVEGSRPVNRENECDKLNESTLANTIENAANNRDVSANIQNITQSIPKENDGTTVRECHTLAGENIPDNGQEAVQRFPEIVEHNVSNNIVQNKYADDHGINQDAEVSVCNEIQANSPSLQKQGKYKCILVY